MLTVPEEITVLLITPPLKMVKLPLPCKLVAVPVKPESVIRVIEAACVPYWFQYMFRFPHITAPLSAIIVLFATPLLIVICPPDETTVLFAAPLEIMTVPEDITVLLITPPSMTVKLPLPHILVLFATPPL